MTPADAWTWLKRAGTAAGALVAIGGLWVGLGLPTPATSADIHKLSVQQAETAVEVYQTKMRSLLAISPPEGTVAHQAWQEELDQARSQAKRAEDRKIELSK